MTYTGDLGGLAGGDAKCQSLAGAAGLGGTWMAWLSDGKMVTPVTRLAHATVPYMLVGGGQIAADWTDLLDGMIAAPIDHDETGTQLGPNAETKVWTGTNADGSPLGPSCGGWTTTGSAATYGQTTSQDAKWSFVSGTPCDNNSFHLYCFEQ
jgi:hypothetical protein